MLSSSALKPMTMSKSSSAKLIGPKSRCLIANSLTLSVISSGVRLKGVKFLGPVFLGIKAESPSLIYLAFSLEKALACILSNLAPSLHLIFLSIQASKMFLFMAISSPWVFRLIFCGILLVED